jgi:hypothetical protein
MIQVFSITILDKKEVTTLLSKYYDSLYLANERIVQKWTNGQIAKYTEIFGKEVKVSAHYRLRPSKDINPMDIAIEYCLQENIKIKDLLGPKRDSELVKARIMINQIVLDSHHRPADIEEHLWGNRIYAHYQKQYKNLSKTDPRFNKKFEEMKDSVMMKLYK